MKRTKPFLRVSGVTYGQAKSILPRAKQALEGAGYSQAEIEEYLAEAQRGDHSHLMVVTLEWFTTY